MTRSFIRPLSGKIILTIFTLIFLAGCKSQQVSGNWADNQMKIDGRIDDWSGKAVNNFEDQSAVIAVSNDSDFLYLHFRTRNENMTRAIKMSGLTIYLNGDGKKEKNFFIKYRGGPSRDLLAAMQGPNSGRSKRNPDRIIDGPEQEKGALFTCYIKDIIIEKPIPPEGDQGPSAAFDTAYGFFSYEFAIPLTESAVRYYGLGVTPGQQITIGAEWGGMDDFKKTFGDRDGGMDGNGGLPGVMGGSPPSSGMGGGPPGGSRMMGGRPDGMEKQEIWFKTTLLKGPNGTGSEK